MSEFENLKNDAEQYGKEHPQQVHEAEQFAERKVGMGGGEQGGQQGQQGQAQQDQQDGQDQYGQRDQQDQSGSDQQSGH